MIKTLDTCKEIKEERANHIEVIEISHDKKIYDSDIQYIDEVIAVQGKEEYTQFINNMKRNILGHTTCTDRELDQLDKKPKFLLLQTQCKQWQILIDRIDLSHSTALSRTKIKHWYHISKQCLQSYTMYHSTD